ncbi:DUF3164 family protein [Yersinia pekkanenii]|uniref:Protein of uncharacterized function (DUF3164) n=1 Tax=Yersinia pekkanenii TaxID=1288385 RepID=A0A0T9R6F6_9GAMM|nr:DUF3164 family protein [Yersinia pekkanenii]CNI46439.1 Protein of uncharacterised function (DUF3164) [Yersinia pekkanenii]CRY65738.1 Protein of uncharacterised function (DUF3164) [Yersinia pekkanenii]
MSDAINNDDYMKDRKGRLVPKGLISDYDILMDEFVNNQITEAHRVQAIIRAFKRQSFNECYAWMDLVAEKFDRKPGGVKGNVTFSSFDGTRQIKISVQESLAFGPELQVAKNIIDECLTEWSVGANKNIKAIIADAFEVDKEGNLSTTRILSLRRIKIDDVRWRTAMEAISESLQIATSKTYLNFKEKDTQGRLINIPLDLAAL